MLAIRSPSNSALRSNEIHYLKINKVLRLVYYCYNCIKVKGGFCMYFKSERSFVVAIFYFLLPLGGITLFTLLSYIGLHSIRWFLIYPLCLMLLVDAVSIWMWFDTGYTITDTQLRIKCSPFRENIDLITIKSIKKIRSYDKQPALSFDRFQISGGVCISPKDKEKFLEIISERCPSIRIDI